MVPREVIAYVQRLRDNGYAAQAIRQNLLASGYTPQEADQALLAVFRPNVMHQGRNWKPLAAGGAAGLLVIGLLLVLFIPSSPAFTMTTRPNSVEARAGSTLSFSENFVFEKELDVDGLEVTHELVAPSGNLLLSVDQHVSIGPSATSTLHLPADLQPGRYLVRTTATGDGHTAESSFSFKALPALPGTTSLPETSTPSETPIENTSTVQECNDFDPCTDDSNKDGKCVFEQMPVCCGDYICGETETSSTCPRDCAAQPEAKSTADIIAEAEQTASDDPARAELLCGTLAQATDADQCYDSVARIASQSETCDKIRDSKTRDSCYLYFAINKNEFAVCEDISDPNLKSSCYSFKNLHDIQGQIPASA
jgi:hypothetical protein